MFKKIVAFLTPKGVRFAVQRGLFFKEYLDLSDLRDLPESGEIVLTWWSKPHRYFRQGCCTTRDYLEVISAFNAKPVPLFKKIDLSKVEKELLNK